MLSNFQQSSVVSQGHRPGLSKPRHGSTSGNTQLVNDAALVDFDWDDSYTQTQPGYHITDEYQFYGVGHYQYPDPEYQATSHQDPYFNVPGHVPSDLNQYDVSLDWLNLIAQAQARRASAGFLNRSLVSIPGGGAQQPFVDPQLLDPNWDPDMSRLEYTHVQHGYNLTAQSQPHHMQSPDERAAYAPTRSKDRSRGSQGESTESSVYSPNKSDCSRRTSYSVGDTSERQALKKSRQPRTRNSAVVVYKPEKPKASADHPWIRTNATTKGLTTRTSKINNYKTSYDYNRPHPVGDWKGSKTEFKYTQFGEWKEKSFSPRQIKEFILEYPRDKPKAKLKLWIQKGPTDSARRYPTTTWSKCRFRDCPAQIHQTGTILHGHYRVAFDETWYRDRENVDPFLTAGYVHLYCMERFLNFADICRRADVEVDTRALTSEPNARFAATLAGAPEAGVAQKFIELCRRGKLHKDDDFKHYPDHSQYRFGEPKPHENTLTYHMTDMKAKSRPRAQRKQFEDRGLKNSHIMVNKGDLEMIFAEKKAQRKKPKSRKRKADESDEDEPQPRKKNTRTTNTRKHKAAESDDESEDELALVKPIRKRAKLGYQRYGSENESSDDEAATTTVTTQPTRRSPRRSNRRVNYNEDILFVPEGTIRAQAQQTATIHQPQELAHPQPKLPPPINPILFPQEGSPPPITAHRNSGSQISQAYSDRPSLSQVDTNGLPEVPNLGQVDLNLDGSGSGTYDYNSTDLSLDFDPQVFKEFLNNDEWLSRRKSSVISLGSLRSAMRTPSASRRKSSGERKVAFALPQESGSASPGRFERRRASARLAAKRLG
ncbi:hypothetical protein K469DRAFT_686533 [Zopfia rhizophila CBS 207.26]|uniref:Uncharacterized protein n=1 Tax=Zopfia rhizophila CBS 207.26 TaxID=1314779 RepID=A0A6A6EU31_9PEZI|nr:hypothetical protein K469DRAFT_686533 [Zopfia rhizophila CBS 207.26]